MFRDGESILCYLGEDRKLYLNHSPGKHICVFEARYFVQSKGNNIISISTIPNNYDGGAVQGPAGTVVQGLEGKKTNTTSNTD